MSSDKVSLRQKLNEELEVIMSELGMAETEKFYWESVISELEYKKISVVSKINDTWVDKF